MIENGIVSFHDARLFPGGWTSPEYGTGPQDTTSLPDPSLSAAPPPRRLRQRRFLPGSCILERIFPAPDVLPRYAAQSAPAIRPMRRKGVLLPDPPTSLALGVRSESQRIESLVCSRRFRFFP